MTCNFESRVFQVRAGESPWLQYKSSEDEKNSKNRNLTRLVIFEPGKSDVQVAVR
jgi:hypothetical protein